MRTAEQTTGLDEAFFDDWATRFLDAWNALDGTAVGALCAEDVVWNDPAVPETMIGRKAVCGLVEMTGRAFPDFHVTEPAPRCISRSAPRVLAPYHLTGTMIGPTDVFAPTGRTMSVTGVDEWTFRGELLWRYRTYYDSIDVARQLGIMPTPGSRAERLVLALQRVQAAIQRRRPTR